MANAPKPVERKRALGNPGHQSLPPVASVISLPSAPNVPPPHLGSAGQRFWSEVMGVASGWIGNTDYPLMVMAAEAYDRRAFMVETLNREGWTTTTDKGYPYKHPLVSALLELEKQLTSWLSLLGLTPTDRSRLGVAEVKAASKLEQMQAARDKRQR